MICCIRVDARIGAGFLFVFLIIIQKSGCNLVFESHGIGHTWYFENRVWGKPISLKHWLQSGVILSSSERISFFSKWKKKSSNLVIFSVNRLSLCTVTLWHNNPVNDEQRELTTTKWARVAWNPISKTASTQQSKLHFISHGFGATMTCLGNVRRLQEWTTLSVQTQVSDAPEKFKLFHKMWAWREQRI